MALMTNAPVVLIDGRAISGRWSFRDRIGLDGLRITWGRKTHTDEAYPAQLALTVLDTDGELPRSADLVGRPVTVKRSDGRLIYRGTLDDFAVSRITVMDPDSSFGARRVWKIDLLAACKLAELANTIPLGPGTDAAWTRLLGPNYWPIERPAARLAAVRAGTPVVAGIAWTDPYPAQLPHAGRVRYRGMSDQMTALDLIESCYNAHPMGYVNYSPQTNKVSIGKPARTPGLELARTGNLLHLRMPDGGHLIPARTIIVDRTAQARTSVHEQIDAVQVSGPTLAVNGDTADWRLDTLERTTAHNDLGLPARREHRISSDAIYQALVDEPEDTEPETVTAFEWPFPLSTVTSEFGDRDTGFHEGIDMGYAPATAGAPIKAAGAGKVVTSRYHTEGGWGNYLVIDHGRAANGKNLMTLYAHMQAVGVAVGTTVARGATIGYVGNTGNSFGAHLHLETWVDGEAINPRTFIATYGAGTAPTPPPPPVEYPSGIWQAALADDLVGIFDQINGLVVHPQVRFDWRRFDYGDDVSDVLLDSFTRGRTLYFPGSMFGPIIDAAGEHEVIGGTLTYEQGWSLDATLAPAIRERGYLRVDQIVTITGPTLSDFDPDLTLADVGNVSKGVTA